MRLPEQLAHDAGWQAAFLLDSVLIVTGIHRNQVQHLFNLRVDVVFRGDLDIDVVLSVGLDFSFPYYIEIGIQTAEPKIIFFPAVRC